MGSTFKDTKGREWRLAITAETLGIVREDTGYEIGKIGAPRGLIDNVLSDLELLTLDTEKFTGVLYSMAREQHDATKQDFLKALGGDALEAARAAFVEAFALFCPSPIRKVLLKVLSGEALKQKAAEALTTALGLQLEEMEESLTLKPYAGKSAEALESTRPIAILDNSSGWPKEAIIESAD